MDYYSNTNFISYINNKPAIKISVSMSKIKYILILIIFTLISCKKKEEIIDEYQVKYSCSFSIDDESYTMSDKFYEELKIKLKDTGRLHKDNIDRNSEELNE